MNELKSYTEYAVSTPTADFVIGFDFNYGEDAVNVTVDDVPATEAGYTVVYLNETTIRLSPSVPSGVVRLQRETDIDQTDHAYRAGAKFIAQTMDENFEQLRHSQQEVRDGFNKLADDTYEIIDTLQEVGQSAQDAADAAEVAAGLANDAAAQVNDKVAKSATLPTYLTIDGGVNPIIGVADGAYFNVRSADDDTIAIEYQNVGGSAVATGKSYPSSTAVQQVIDDVAVVSNKQIKHNKAFPSVLDNSNVVGDGVANDQPALQEYFRDADDNRKSSIFFPLRNYNYLIDSPLVIQEPLMIYGDAGATYNHGTGKTGKIIIGASADYAFNLGNERTYTSLPADRVLDVDLKKTRNPADQWTLKNLAFAQAQGIPAFTKTAIKHTAATDGPDRGFIMREVSAAGLKHVLHVTNQNKTTQLANLIVENCCLSECELPIFAEGMVLGLRFVGNQSEQNLLGSIKGTFSSGITIEDNMLEGQKNPFELVIPPITGNRPKISFKRNYLEANAGDFILKLRSSSADSELELAENFLWTATTKDFVQIDDGARWSITNRENRAIAFLGASGVSKASSMFGNIKYYKQYFDKSVNYGASVYTAEFDNLQSRPSAVSAVLPTTAQVYDHPLYGKLHYEDRNNGYLTINQPVAAGDVIAINMLCSAETGADYILQCYNANISSSLGELSVNPVTETKGEMTLLTFTLKVATASTALRIRLYSPSQATGGRKIFGACAENMGAHVASNSKDIYPTLPKLTRYTAMNPAATQSNSTATDVVGLKTDFNALLAKLKVSGQML